MKLNGNKVDLAALVKELRTAGIDVPALGTNGDDLHTYDADGRIVDVPLEAAAVVDAHVPAPVPLTARQQLRAALQTATTVAEVKAALIAFAQD